LTDISISKKAVGDYIVIAIKIPLKLRNYLKNNVIRRKLDPSRIELFCEDYYRYKIRAKVMSKMKSVPSYDSYAEEGNFDMDCGLWLPKTILFETDLIDTGGLNFDIDLEHYSEFINEYGETPEEAVEKIIRATLRVI
jgi:hypothetical protein